MVNKKGFIRTLEAVIAIILVLGLIVYLTPSKELKVGAPSNVKNAQKFIFKEVLTNGALRDCIREGISYQETSSGGFVSIGGNCKLACKGEFQKFLDPNIPPGYNYCCEICDFSDKIGCGECTRILPENRDVFSGAVFLRFGSVSKIFGLFLYEK